ncbi:sensor histidine kinase [Luteolibacter soli]|uniref:histidine kinase n=1 Tax=Luteolibacter soli TaxID=3135280 RepID=A0ABU9B1E7_9BACT
MEHGFVLLLVVLCAVLTILQFRWTGELAKAEFERLGGKQEEATRDFCEAFDGELGRSCTALVPSGRDLSDAAIARRVSDWRKGNPRPIFRRLALATPVRRVVTLRMIDLDTGAMTDSEWPAEWSALKSNLSRKGAGGSAPYSDEGGMLLEFPLRGGSRGPGGDGGPPDDRGPRSPGDDDGPRGGPPETGWFIAELDSHYVTSTWLPDLSAKYLNPDNHAVHQVKVMSNSGDTIFTTEPAKELEAPVVVAFNHRGRDGQFPGPDQTLWTLETRRQRGALEQIVATSRRRNLVLAVAVNGLILAAGWALVRHTRKSRQLAEAQMDFVATVSHELRTPLTVIRGAAHNLKRGIVNTPEGIGRYSGMILQHADQLSEMVQQVLDFSAVRKGSVLSNKTPVDVGRVLDEALANTAAETSGCEIEVARPEALPAVMGDEAALRRAFQNLLSNAANHGGSGGWIGVRSRIAGQRLEVHIADRGPGIPKAEQEKIFEPFFRGAAAHGAQIRGSGIGLSLVKEIIEAHGGEILVGSGENGRGAIFTVSLPIAEGGDG